MPTKYSAIPVELCRHEKIHVGCPSCTAYNIGQEMNEAIKQAKLCEEDVKKYETLLKQEDLSVAEKSRLVTKLEQAAAQRTACSERVQSLETRVSELDLMVEALCAMHEPGEIMSVFEGDAQSREHGFEQTFKEAKAIFAKMNLEKEDPAREARRKKIAARLEAWTPPDGFDDGRLQHPDPRSFYDGPSLTELDLKKIELEEKELELAKKKTDQS